MPLTAANDEAPPLAEANVRPPRGLATTALALGILALGLFWLGVVSMLIALLAVVCGTIAASRASTANRPVGRRATAGIITGVLAFAASFGLLLYRHVTADGETAARPEVSREVPAEGREIPTGMLQSGDCFNAVPRPDPPVQPGGWIPVSEAVSLVPCQGPHEQEVYHRFELAAGPYPGDEQVQALASEQCSEQFHEYVGVAQQESELDFIYVFPVQDGWSQRTAGADARSTRLRDATSSDRWQEVGGERPRVTVLTR